MPLGPTPPNGALRALWRMTWLTMAPPLEVLLMILSASLSFFVKMYKANGFSFELMMLIASSSFATPTIGKTGPKISSCDKEISESSKRRINAPA